MEEHTSELIDNLEYDSTPVAGEVELWVDKRNQDVYEVDIYVVRRFGTMRKVLSWYGCKY